MIIRSIIKTIIISGITLIFFDSCIKIIEEVPYGTRIVVNSVLDDGIGNQYISSRGDALESEEALRGKTFGIYASRTSNLSTYFTASATVSNSDQSATLLPAQYWPIDKNGSLKIFSWYPYSGTYKPTVNFATPAQMAMSYSADANAANHVDVLAAVSEPAWGSAVNIGFKHMLTKVTFTFQKVEPAPAVVTVSSIEFRDVGKSGEYVVTEIPDANTKNGKPNFLWNSITSGTITSTITANNEVTDTKRQIGDTFLMLPASTFPATAKVIVTTSMGVHEFLLRDIVASTPHAWQSGEYINYNITITDGTFQLEAQPVPWTENPVNVIFDRDYYLKVSESVVQLAAKGITIDLTVETNYNAVPSTGFPAGAFLSTLDNPGTNLSVVNLDWATATLSQTSASGGIYIYQIKVAVTDYAVSSGSRWARYYINAGNLRHRMAIIQYGGDGVWLTATVEDDDDLSSLDRKKIVFTPGAPGGWTWKITGLSDPDDIFLNKETILGATGGMAPDNQVYFYFKANAPSGKTATLTVTNTNGSNAPVWIAVTSP